MVEDCAIQINNGNIDRAGFLIRIRAAIYASHAGSDLNSRTEYDRILVDEDEAWEEVFLRLASLIEEKQRDKFVDLLGMCCNVNERFSRGIFCIYNGLAADASSDIDVRDLFEAARNKAIELRLLED